MWDGDEVGGLGLEVWEEFAEGRGEGRGGCWG